MAKNSQILVQHIVPIIFVAHVSITYIYYVHVGCSCRYQERKGNRYDKRSGNKLHTYILAYIQALLYMY